MTWHHIEMTRHHIGLTRSHIEMTRNHIGLTRSHIEMTRHHIGLTRSHIGLTRSHIEMTRSHIEMTRSHIGVTRSHIEMTRSHIGVTRSHIEMTRDHIEMTRSHIGVTWDHIEMTRNHIGVIPGPMSGWRIDLLFRENNIDSAFREINNLLGEAENLDWAWPWCAQLVSTYGKSTADCTQKSLAFWHNYLRRYPEDVSGKVELLLCSCFLHESGNPIKIEFGEIKAKAMHLTKCNAINYALLLDRVGHWAQSEHKWKDAEECYRIAYEADPEKYGYCLGTALNFLERHQEALPILLDQAEKYLPDAMSWFQVAVAYEGIAEIDRSIFAYKQTLKLEPDYELAWFNLGGLYWNSHDVKLAKSIWGEAVKRFPDHKLTKKLLRDLPTLFK